MLLTFISEDYLVRESITMEFQGFCLQSNDITFSSLWKFNQSEKMNGLIVWNLQRCTQNLVKHPVKRIQSLPIFVKNSILDIRRVLNTLLSEVILILYSCYHNQNDFHWEVAKLWRKCQKNYSKHFDLKRNYRVNKLIILKCWGFFSLKADCPIFI